MKIVVLDGFTLNPNDLDWSPLSALGETTIYERTSPSEIVARAVNADVILTNKVPISADILAHLPKLKAIFVMATGYNVVDVVAARKYDIPVCNVAGYGTNSVAQHTFALILALMNRIAEYQTQVQQGEWQKRQDFCFYLHTQYELAGKNLGIIGLGDIGKAVAKIGQAFGMNILAIDRGKKSDDLPNVRFLDEKTLFAESDIVSLHCPLISENAQFINQVRLSWMKPTALLINTARGGLIHEEDLAQALQNNVISGAALDVLTTEPPSNAHPLLHAPNCLITPHIAWSAQEARQRLLDILVQNVQAFQAGKPQNVVN